MTREEKIRWLQDVRDGKIQPRKMNYNLVAATDLNEMIRITRNIIKGIMPNKEETAFMEAAYNTQGLKYTL